jgi:hypothetical protein
MVVAHFHDSASVQFRDRDFLSPLNKRGRRASASAPPIGPPE